MAKPKLPISGLMTVMRRLQRGINLRQTASASIIQHLRDYTVRR